MIKRVIAIVSVLAMLISVLPANVTAQQNTAVPVTHGHTENSHACSEHCDSDGQWLPWSQDMSQPVAGHYYLTGNVKLSQELQVSAGQQLSICLNGYELRSADGARMFVVYGKLIISDCTAYTDGSGNYVAQGGLTGVDYSNYGGVANVKRKGTFVLESGRIYGNDNTVNGGVVYLQAGTSSGGAGGVFIMDGGEISGNTNTANGGVVYNAGADSGNTPAQFIMNGGTISGNCAVNGGAIYINNSGIATITGGTITGNTSDKGAIFARNRAKLTISNTTVSGNLGKTDTSVTGVYIDNNTPVVTLSGKVVAEDMYFSSTTHPGVKVDALEKGSAVSYTTANAEVADATKVIGLAANGTQDSWDCHWVTANGQPVSRVDGVFTFGHYHGKQKYEPWNGDSSHAVLRSEGCYYLVNDIVRTADRNTANLRNVTYCLNGYDIINENTKARLFNVASGCTVTIEDCTAYTDDAGNYISGGLTGGNTAAADGSVVKVNAGGTFNLLSGKIYGTVSTGSNGSPVYITPSSGTGKAVFNMSGGEISGNSAKNGGAVILPSGSDGQNLSQFHMTGGVIRGNTATGEAGAIYSQGAQVLLQNVTITGNTGRNGSAVTAYGGTLTMENAVIEKNNATNSFGAVHIQRSGKYGAITATVKGSTRIFDNTVKGTQAQNLYMRESESYITVDSFTGRVGVTMAAQRLNAKLLYVSTALNGTDPTGFVTSDVSDHQIVVQEDRLYYSPNHAHCVDGKTDCQHTQEGWIAWTDTTTLPGTSGNYYLVNDVALASQANLAGDMNIRICLNGKTVTASYATQGDARDRIFSLNENAQVTVTDCTAHADANGNYAAGSLTGGSNSAVLFQKNAQGAAFTLYEGIITGNSRSDNGGAICIQGTGTVNIYGGEISGNTTTAAGAGIFAGTDTVLNLYGGRIADNKAEGSGGGVYTLGAVVNLSGTAISNNQSAINGGGLMLNSAVVDDRLIPSVLNMTGGSITGNTATSNGGGVCLLRSTGNFTGGTVSDNSTQATGGGIHLSGSQVTLQNVTIADNRAGQNGGGVSTGRNSVKLGGTSVDLYPKLTIKDGTVISGNTGKNGGGIILQSKVTFTMEGGSIINNKSTKTAGGMYVSADGTVNMTGGTIAYNETDGNGAGIYHAKSKGTYTGGTIAHNTAAKYGGGMYTNGSRVTISGSMQIRDNKALNSGAGVVFSADSKAAISGGMISENAAAMHAGGVLTQSRSTLNLTGGTITGNRAIGNGAGLFLSTNSYFTMSGGTVSENITGNRGAGMYLASPATITGGQICQNQAAGNEKYKNPVAGAIMMDAKCTTLDISNCQITGNSSAVNAGAIRVSNGTFLTAVNCNISGNTSGKNGGAVEAYGNYAIRDSKVCNNRAANNGGALCNTRLVSCNLEGTTLEGNTAGGMGGAVYVDKATTTVITGSALDNNTSGSTGGAFHVSRGAYAEISDTQMTGNKAAAEGGALWAIDDLTMHSLTVTGNTSGGMGGAVYLGDSEYDGHSYLVGTFKMSGNMRIYDNQGPNPDLYLGERTAIAVTAQGLGQDTHIHVNLHSGVLTDAIYGAYDYEGGSCDYTITYGDRSLADPECAPKAQQAEAAEENTVDASGDILLYVGIGIFAVAVAVAAVLLIGKKKKDPQAGSER